MVCHCLVVETSDGLVLVDTGIGAGDVADPSRLGRRFLAQNAPPLALEETAVAQIEGLGLRREDVHHIVPTHLDLDRAGGLSDFPHAEVHVLQEEHDAAMAPVRRAYRPAQWAHGPRWVCHRKGGQRWLGFEAVRPIPELEDVLLVPLAGHSPGHCGVAAKSAGGWLPHAGDAYFNDSEIDPVRPAHAPRPVVVSTPYLLGQRRASPTKGDCASWSGITAARCASSPRTAPPSSIDSAQWEISSRRRARSSTGARWRCSRAAR